MISQAPDYRKLATYYEETYAPARLAKVSDSTRRNWRKAIRAFLRFTSPAVTIGELNQETLEEFDEWLADGNRNRGPSGPMSLAVVTYYGGVVRRVLHAADQSRFKTRAMAPLNFIPENTNEEGTLFWFFEHVYIPSRLGGVKESSLAHMRVVLRSLDRWAGRSVKVAELSDELVTGFLNWFAGRRAPATINTMRGCIVTLWNLAWMKKIIRRKPRVEKIRCPKRRVQCWSSKELNQLLLSCRETPGWVDGMPAGLWWYLLNHLAYYTALRISALLQLRPEHFDMADCALRVPAELMKNNCEQVFHLHPDTIEAIGQSLRYQPARQLLLPWPKSEHMLYVHYRQILRRAGLPTGRRDLFHRLRRTSATYLAAEVGIALASRHLGHSTQQVTQRYIDEAKMPEFRTAELLPKPTVGPPEAIDVCEASEPVVKLPANETIRELLSREPFGAAELQAVVKYANSLGVKSSDFAVRIGVSSTMLWGYCKGQIRISPERLAAVRAVFGLDDQSANLVDARFVAGRLGIVPDTVHARVRRGEIPQPLKFGKTMRWEKEAIEALIVTKKTSMEGAPVATRPLVATPAIRKVLNRKRLASTDVRALLDHAHASGVPTAEFARRMGIRSQHLLRLARGAGSLTPERRLMIQNMFNVEGGA